MSIFTAPFVPEYGNEPPLPGGPVGTLKKNAPGQMCCCNQVPRCPDPDPMQAQEPWLGYFDPLDDYWVWPTYWPQSVIPMPPHTDSEYTKTQPRITTSNGYISPINHPIAVERPMDLWNEPGTFYDWTVEILYQTNAEYRISAPGTLVECEEGASRILFYDPLGLAHTEQIVWTPGTWHKLRVYAAYNTSTTDWIWRLFVDDALVFNSQPGYGWQDTFVCGELFYMTAGQYSGLITQLGFQNFYISGEFNAYQ